MQYNIFKVEKKESLIEEMLEKGYYTNSKIIQSGDYELSLYYSKNENSTISWQKVLSIFGINITIDKDSLKGILIAENSKKMYAITYGMSSSLVQKYCDSDFPMDIAKRVEVSKVKRKASKILNGSTSSLVKTLANSNLIVVDRGESIVNLEIIPDEEEKLGKCIGIGKSVRINIDKEIDSIDEIISLLDEINTRSEKRPIPLFIKVKNEELITNIWEYLNDDFINKIVTSSFSLDEMNILGSSIFFDDSFIIELSFKNRKEEIPFLNTYYVKDFISKYNIEPSKVYDYLKIKYISDEGFSFVKSFKETITFDFQYNDDKYVVYDGDIYYYNNDFYNNIVDGIKNIRLEKYKEDDNMSHEWYEKYLKDNNLVDVKASEKNGKIVTYREKAINNELSIRYNYDNIDRNLVSICKEENYKIEIADLAKENDVLYAVKIGTPRDFCYAIDQLNLIVDTFISNSYETDELIEKYKNVEKIGLWLYVTGKNKFSDHDGNINILSFDSVMFLNKLVEWSNKVTSANYIPVIRINYYIKD